jgi:PAS domain S-box-containing protein
MIERFCKWQQGLSVQMVIMLIGLVFLTASAVGIPALFIIRDQLDRQSRALLGQGSQTTHAVLASWQSDLDNLTILTAQRPTLRHLIEQNNLAELQPYLVTLQEGAGADLVLVCSPSQTTLVQVGQVVGDHLCSAMETGIHLEETPSGTQGWLLSARAISDDDASSPRVVLGVMIDDAFARQLQNDTGMQQILLLRGAYGASSFTGGRQLWDLNHSPAQSTLFTITLDSIPYNAMRSSYPGSELELVVALPMTDLLVARQQITWVIVAGIFGVILLSSALGIARSRRISRPLERLRDAAEELRMGELSRPIQVDSNIRELAMLSYALDDARIALNHSLTELRQEKDWSEHILESVVEGIVTIDRRKRITFFSHGAEQITGWQQEQVNGRSIDEVLPLIEEQARFSQQLPLPGNRQKITVQLRSGSAATLAVTVARLVPPEAGKADTALVLRDVSSEEAIRRLLGDFLANIAHEFRTPLSALAASIELLLDRLPELEPHELQELLNNIHLGTISLQNLIDNLLEGASIETGRFRVRVQPCYAPDIVDEAVNAIQPLIDKYGLTVSKSWPDDLPLVLADFRRTTQVIVNLLSNAVKWGPAGSEILLSIVPAADSLAVHVVDCGPGIPPQDLPDLFYRFGRQPEGDAGGHGAGLGLSVVKAIVEAQGGQVSVTNRPGGGADFWFTLCVSAMDENDEGTV